MTYTAKKIEAPKQHAWWELPVAWVEVADADGNTCEFAVMKDGKITDERGYSIGDATDPEVVAIKAAVDAALAA